MITVLASIPSPSTNSIDIGPLSLNAYGLLIALGVVAAIWLFGRRLEQRGLGTTDDASAIGMWGAGAGIVGARLYHVATDWDRFSDDLGSIPKIWEGGLGIPGGLLLGTAVGLWVGTRRGIGVGEMLTCAAPAIPLAQAIGRWGNWFNQELFGRPTDLPWGLEIDDAHTPAGYASDTTFHPTFLYESLWNLGLVVVLLWIDRKLRLGPGRLFAVYLIGYGIGRFWIEGLRIDAVQLDDVLGLRWNQWVSLAAIAAGVVWLVVTRGQRWPDDETSDGADESVADDGNGDVDDIGDVDDVGDGDPGNDAAEPGTTDDDGPHVDRVAQEPDSAELDP